MSTETPTMDQIRELLNFLPLFSREDFQPVLEWIGVDPDPDGAAHFPYPVYHPAVLEFFQLAGQPHWSDYGYRPDQEARRLADPEYIRTADLEGIQSLLTYCVRGERFCDGHWEGVIRAGCVARLLVRLAELAG